MVVVLRLFLTVGSLDLDFLGRGSGKFSGFRSVELVEGVIGSISKLVGRKTFLLLGGTSERKFLLDN